MSVHVLGNHLLLYSFFLNVSHSRLHRVILYVSLKSAHTQKYFHLAEPHKQSQTQTLPPQHQRESVMSIVEGVDTALSTNMLISYATETLHPSAVLKMGHSTATKTHGTQMKTHQYTCTCI